MLLVLECFVNDEAGSFAMGANVNPTKELQAILKNGGGLKLAYRLMKKSLYLLFHKKFRRKK